MEKLLAITFVYGVIHLITMSKLFDIKFKTITRTLVDTVPEHKHDDNWLETIIKFLIILFHSLGIFFFYFSLCFQSWYWLFNN